jgi:hypothetical protein
MWKEIKQKCEQGRRTGTGVTAEGDMLAALGLTYGTIYVRPFSMWHEAIPQSLSSPLSDTVQNRFTLIA